MSVFTPLKGIAHTKAYIKDQSYKAQYKQFTQDNQTNWIDQLSDLQTCVISNDSNTFYIMSPSLYKEGQIQLTTFIRNLPHCHNTYPTLSDLVKDNHINFTLNQYTITQK